MDYYDKKRTKINKKKFYMLILGILTGVSGLDVGTPLSLTGVGSTVGVPTAHSSAFIASAAGVV